jgi:hypothetical protein
LIVPEASRFTGLNSPVDLPEFSSDLPLAPT